MEARTPSLPIPSGLRVLLIEPDGMTAERIRRSLVDSVPCAPPPVCRVVESLAAMHDLAPEQFDVVVTASVLPDACGLDVLVYLQGTSPDTPVIMTGAEADAAMAVDDRLGQAGGPARIEDPQRMIEGDLSAFIGCVAVQQTVPRHMPLGQIPDKGHRDALHQTGQRRL